MAHMACKPRLAEEALVRPDPFIDKLLALLQQRKPGSAPRLMWSPNR